MPGSGNSREGGTGPEPVREEAAEGAGSRHTGPLQASCLSPVLQSQPPLWEPDQRVQEAPGALGTLGTQGPGSPPCLWPGGCRVDALGRSWLGKDQAPPLPPQLGLGWWLGGGWQRRTPSGRAQGRPALSSGHSPGQQGAPWGLRHGRLETEKQGSAQSRQTSVRRRGGQSPGCRLNPLSPREAQDLRKETFHM